MVLLWIYFSGKWCFQFDSFNLEVVISIFSSHSAREVAGGYEILRVKVARGLRVARESEDRADDVKPANRQEQFLLPSPF